MLFCFAWFTTLILTECYRKIAQAYRIIDIPNERSSHETPTVRGGGIIFSLLWLLLAQYDWTVTLAILALIAVSYWDDLYSLPVQWRSLTHIIVMSCALSAIYATSDLTLPWISLRV